MSKAKKIISLLLSVIMIMSVFNIVPFSVNAAEAEAAETGATSGTTGDCTWTLDNGVLTISGNGEMGDYDSTLKNDHYVTTAPWGGYSFNTVVIESGVTSIGNSAFSDCSSLSSVTIGNSVTSIGGNVFEGCTALASVTIPDSVTSIGESAFSDCSSLSSVTIGNSVTTIGAGAFSDCECLSGVTIPDSVTSIGEYAFDNTAWYNNQPDGLVYAGKVAYKMKGTCPSDVVIKDGIVSITYSAFCDCESLMSLTIPGSVTSIGGSAFSGCTGLTSVTIPDSVTSIGSFAFYECTSLTSVTIPDSVTSIVTGVFEYCTGLMGVTIPDSVTSIGYSAFNGCTSLTSIDIPDSVTNIGSSAFDNTAWYNNQPDGLVYAGKAAYKMKGTCPSEVVIKDGIVSITESAFFGCESLMSVTIPDSVTSIGEWAFYNCTSLMNVTIGNSVTSIGGLVFYGCTALASVTIPDSVTSIGNSAFSDCSSLSSVTIGNSVTTIGAGAFSGCECLSDVTIPDSVTSIGEYAFDNTAWYNNQPDGLVYAGKAAYKMKGTCPSEVVIKDGIVSITESAFFGCESLMSVTIPDSVTSIGVRAFYNCTGLTSVTIPDSVTSIGDSAFYDCTSLTSVTIGDSVTSIGDEALGYYYDDDWNKLKIDGFTIYGYEGSEAERYAKDNEFTFIKLTENKDEASGIITTVPDNIELRVVDVLDQMPAGTIKAYDISLTKDGETVQPENVVTVKIPCTNENAKVYRFETDGKMIDMNAKYMDGYMVFTSDHFSVYVLAEPKPAGVTVSGTITSYIDDSNVTVKLTGVDNNFTAEVKGTDAYEISAVPAGEYTLTVSKANHVTREYTVTVDNDEVTQDVKLSPKGDVNGDGETDIMDCSLAQRYIRELTTLDAYQIACGDVSGTGDGELDIQDVSRILRHIRELAMLY